MERINKAFLFDYIGTPTKSYLGFDTRFHLRREYSFEEFSEALIKFLNFCEKEGKDLKIKVFAADFELFHKNLIKMHYFIEIISMSFEEKARQHLECYPRAIKILWNL